MFRAALVLGACAAPVAAQSVDTTGRALPPYRHRLLGVFDESGSPLQGVEVADVVTGTAAVTTPTGTVSLFFLPDGGSLIRLRKVGYEAKTLMAAISPVDTTPITVVLAKAVALPTVTVKDTAARKYISPALNAFEERRRRGFGNFIAEDDMRKADNRSLPLFLASRMPGLTTRPGGSGRTFLVSSRKPCAGSSMRRCSNPDCFITVYVDGVRIFDVSTIMPSGPLGQISDPSQIPDFEHMNARDYAAAEFYAGGASIPVEYNVTGSGCGTLLLWTRER